jgi:lysophospholipase L1-like esterase
MTWLTRLFAPITKAVTGLLTVIHYWVFPPDLVMIGDSIIANMAAGQPMLPEPFKSAYNMGVHGETTTQIRARIGSIPKGTKMVLLEGGGNNFNLGNTSTIIDDYKAMLLAIPTSVHVIVLGIARVDDPVFNAETAGINSLINGIAITRPNTVVATAAQNTSMSGLTIDGQHPTPAGYVALVNALLPLVK